MGEKRKLSELLSEFKSLREEWSANKSNKDLKRRFKKAKVQYKAAKQLKALSVSMKSAQAAWKENKSDKTLKSAWKTARKAYREFKAKMEDKDKPESSATQPEAEEAVVEAEQLESAESEKKGPSETKPATSGGNDEKVRVFCANLSFSIDEETLMGVFVEGGVSREDILGIAWGEDKVTKEFKGYAHVDFKTQNAADTAMKLSKTMVLGREMRLEASSTTSKKADGFCSKYPAEAPAPVANPKEVDRCFCGNLSWKIDKDKIISAFLELKLNVTHVFWVTDKQTGQFYGSSFLTFETPEQAATAVAYSEAGLCIMGRPASIGLSPHRNPPKIKPKLHVPRETSERPEGGTKTAFVGNLCFSIDEKILSEFLGGTKEIRWLTHKDSGEFKGSAFVDFESEEGVDNAMKKNGEKLLGRPVRIDYA